MTSALRPPFPAQPLAWLVEFDQMVKPDVWEPVAHVVYEEPEGHFEYIEVFYNRSRRHSTLGYSSPVRFFEDWISNNADQQSKAA